MGTVISRTQVPEELEDEIFDLLREECARLRKKNPSAGALTAQDAADFLRSRPRFASTSANWDANTMRQLFSKRDAASKSIGVDGKPGLVPRITCKRLPPFRPGRIQWKRTEVAGCKVDTHRVVGSRLRKIVALALIRPQKKEGLGWKYLVGALQWLNNAQETFGSDWGLRLYFDGSLLADKDEYWMRLVDYAAGLPHVQLCRFLCPSHLSSSDASFHEGLFGKVARFLAWGDTSTVDVIAFRDVDCTPTAEDARMCNDFVLAKDVLWYYPLYELGRGCPSWLPKEYADDGYPIVAAGLFTAKTRKGLGGLYFKHLMDPSTYAFLSESASAEFGRDEMVLNRVVREAFRPEECVPREYVALVPSLSYTLSGIPFSGVDTLHHPFAEITSLSDVPPIPKDIDSSPFYTNVAPNAKSSLQVLSSLVYEDASRSKVLNACLTVIRMRGSENYPLLIPHRVVELLKRGLPNDNLQLAIDFFKAFVNGNGTAAVQRLVALSKPLRSFVVAVEALEASLVVGMTKARMMRLADADDPEDEL